MSDSDLQSRETIKVISSRIMLSTANFDVRQDEIIDLAGVVRQYSYVHLTGGVVIVPCLPDGKVILLRQFRYLAGKQCWELPAGGIREGESPEEAAQRELEEETGFRAGHLTKLLEFFPSNGTSDEVVHAYVATDLQKTVQHLDATEIDIVLRPVELDVALQMVRSGKVPGGASMVSLLFYYLETGAT